MFYYTEILLCLFALYCLFCAWPLKNNYFEHSEVTCNWITPILNVCWDVSALHSACGLTSYCSPGGTPSVELHLWGSESLAGAESTELFHLDLSSSTPFTRLAAAAGSSINPWAFHFLTQLRVTEHKINACQERRRKANNRQEKRLYSLTGKQSLSTRKRSTSRTCCKCIFFLKKEKKTLVHVMKYVRWRQQTGFKQRLPDIQGRGGRFL